MVFHEITKQAIERALGETREIDDRLVDAQETRRILDRLYGYEVSPVLWRKVMKGLSAGRVQSVATRLVVERERERIAFRAAEYWDIVGDARPGRVRGAPRRARRPQGRPGTRLRPQRRARDARTPSCSTQAPPRSLAAGARGRRVHGPLGRAQAVHPPAGRAVHDLDAPAGGEPQAPLLGRSTRCASPSASTRTASSPTCAPTRRRSRRRRSPPPATRRAQLYGAESVPAEPRHYNRKVKNAQEAHEAIRPAGDRFRTPDEVAARARARRGRALRAVWKRTVASQMADARGETVSVRIGATAADGREAEFATAGTVITFRGFMLAYEEGRDEAVAARRGGAPPAAARRGRGARADSRSSPSRTRRPPPPRYTEATLVRALEERGIGRPSTYASILGTILDRGYVRKVGQALVPTFLAFAVTNLLEQHFGRLVDYEFTALMEDDLDRIAAGDEERSAWLRRFYFGDGDGDEGLQGARLGPRRASTPARSTRSRSATGSSSASAATGPYIERNGERVTIGDDIAPDELTVERGRGAPLAEHRRARARRQPDDAVGRSRSRADATAPTSPSSAEDGEKPRTASLFKSMSPETVTLEEALRLLSLPRVARRRSRRRRGGRRLERPLRPVRPKGAATRSLESEEQLLTLSLDEALALLAQPKQRGRRRGRAAAARARRRPGERQADRRRRRPLRPVRHRRRDQREPAHERRRRDAHLRARGRADGRPPRARAGEARSAARSLTRTRVSGVRTRSHTRLHRTRSAILAAARKRSRVGIALPWRQPRRTAAWREARVCGNPKNPLIRLAIRGQMSYGAKA